MIDAAGRGDVGESSVGLLVINSQTIFVRRRIGVVAGAEDQVKFAVVVEVGQRAEQIALVPVWTTGFCSRCGRRRFLMSARAIDAEAGIVNEVHRAVGSRALE